VIAGSSPSACDAVANNRPTMKAVRIWKLGFSTFDLFAAELRRFMNRESETTAYRAVHAEEKNAGSSHPRPGQKSSHRSRSQTIRRAKSCGKSGLMGSLLPGGSRKATTASMADSANRRGDCVVIVRRPRSLEWNEASRPVKARSLPRRPNGRQRFANSLCGRGKELSDHRLKRPHSGSAVEGGGGELAAVGRKRDVVDRVSVALQRVQHSSRPGVLNQHRRVAAS
jgi:hypothetical protein